MFVLEGELCKASTGDYQPVRPGFVADSAPVSALVWRVTWNRWSAGCRQVIPKERGVPFAPEAAGGFSHLECSENAQVAQEGIGVYFGFFPV